MNDKRDKTKTRLYNLTYQVRKKGFRIDHRQRTIYYNWSDPESTNATVVKRLQTEFNYVLQSEIR